MTNVIPTNDQERQKIQFWRDDAFEAAARIADTWALIGGEEGKIASSIAADIRTMCRPRNQHD